MTATIYIIKTASAYEFGLDPVVRLFEPESVSRAWIRRLTVDLPDGFRVSETIYGEPAIYRGAEHYELSTNKRDDPVIIDHTENGKYIPLKVLSEGWG